MDSFEIRKYLPHRCPFILVDRVLYVMRNECIRAYKNVSMNEEIFNGHFPDNPIFPGVMIVEA
jgi:3-hydroxyacyl-[acyl-carrier-protein] dehydratase